MKKVLCIILAVMFIVCFAGCEYEDTGAQKDINQTQEVANRLQTNQPTPTDIDYSLERYNLTRRAYWVNGMREKANTLPCAVDKPLGHIVLFTESGAVVGAFVVDGRFNGIPCKRKADDVLGYYDTVTGTFFEPTIGTPTVVE